MPLRTGSPAEYRDLFKRLNISNDDFIRTTEPRHIKAVTGHLAAGRRIEATSTRRRTKGWYCTVDELFVPEAQLVDGRCPTCGNPVGAPERGELLLQAVRLPGAAARALPIQSRVSDAGHPAQRNDRVRLGGPPRSQRQPHVVQVGHSGAGRSRRTSMYVWFDALTNYITAVGFPDDEARFATVLAGRRASHGQGDRPAAHGRTGRPS